jgi:hypothetical protein
MFDVLLIEDPLGEAPKESRRAVLQGLDGIVFVADSGPGRELANRESLEDLATNLVMLGLSGDQLRRLPRAFQWNKRDLPGAIPVERMRAQLNPGGAPDFEAIASQGRGVSETLRSMCKAVLARLSQPEFAESASPRA